MIVSDCEVEKVEVENGRVLVSVRVNGKEILTFDSHSIGIYDMQRDIEQTTELEVLWASITAILRQRLADLSFDKERILSYWRRYVKWWLKGRGERDTLEGRSDGLYILFSRETDERTRLLNALFAYSGYVEEVEKHKLSLDETNRILSAINGGGNLSDFPGFLNFYNEMMVFSVGEDGVFYEDINEFENKLKMTIEVLESVSEAYRQKAVLLASVVSGRRSAQVLKEELTHLFMNGAEGLIDKKISNGKKEVG